MHGPSQVVFLVLFVSLRACDKEGRKEEEGLGGKCGRGRLLEVLSWHSS